MGSKRMFTITSQTVANNSSEEQTYNGAAYKKAMDMAAGLGMIGSRGLYSCAYSSEETPFVVKIGGMCDTGYLAYLQVMHELEIQNPYLPRILDVHYFVHEEDTPESMYKSYFVVRMEKLTKGNYQDAWCDYNGTDFENECRFIRYLAGDKLSLVSNEEQIADAVAVLQLAKERAQQKKEAVAFDLHCGNFMLRGEQLVITDPLA